MSCTMHEHLLQITISIPDFVLYSCSIFVTRTTAFSPRLFTYSQNGKLTYLMVFGLSRRSFSVPIPQQLFVLSWLRIRVCRWLLVLID